MSGVIDANGVQWERCNCCGEFERMDRLAYMRPRGRFTCGLDLCRECAPIPALVQDTDVTGLTVIRGEVASLLAQWGPLTRESGARHCRASRIGELVEDELGSRTVSA